MSIKLLNRVAGALAAALIAAPCLAADKTTNEDEPVMEERSSSPRRIAIRD